MSAPSNRLLSLDAFRGLTVAGMILVNTPGNWQYVYPPLRHAEWHGITPTDLVFPFFLFIVGISITLAYSKKLETRAPKPDMYKKIVFRFLKIFGLGLFLNLFPEFDFAEIRVPGVLNRISLVFLACAFLFLNSNWKTQAWTAVALLFGYWAALMWIPVPEFGAGVLEPGKDLGAWVDRMIVPGVLYQKTWDPEGLLSTLPAIATGIAGMLTGKLLTLKMPIEKKVAWLFFAGFTAFVLGSIWNWFFPINKNLWSSSYVVYTAGLGAMVLAACMWLVEYLKFERWTQFGVIFGSNAITAYVIAGMLPDLLELLNLRSGPVNALMGAGVQPELASLIWAVSFVLLCFVPVYFLWKKKIFIRL